MVGASRKKVRASSCHACMRRTLRLLLLLLQLELQRIHAAPKRLAVLVALQLGQLPRECQLPLSQRRLLVDAALPLLGQVRVHAARVEVALDHLVRVLRRRCCVAGRFEGRMEVGLPVRGSK